MKIGILSRSPRSYSTKRLKEAAKSRGHNIRVLDTLKFSIFAEKKSRGYIIVISLLSAIMLLYLA